MPRAARAANNAAPSAPHPLDPVYLADATQAISAALTAAAFNQGAAAEEDLAQAGAAAVALAEELAAAAEVAADACGGGTSTSAAAAPIRDRVLGALADGAAAAGEANAAASSTAAAMRGAAAALAEAAAGYDFPPGLAQALPGKAEGAVGAALLAHATDFQALLARARATASLPGDVARASAITAAQATIHDVITDGVGRGAATAAATAAAAAARDAAVAAGEVVVDEDAAGGGAAWKNGRCPLTLKPLAELADPVADGVGYVYERAALEAAFAAAAAGPAAGRGGARSRGAQAAAAAAAAADPSVRCPVVGASHLIRPSDLRSVRREIKREAQAAARRGDGEGVDLDLA